MGKSIAIFNQKGGVGKTTTNINLAACLAMKGIKVLVLDIDPQGNTTSGLGVSKRGLEKTSYDLLVEDNIDPASTILQTMIPGLDIIPADRDLATITSGTGSARRLQRALEPIKESYDLIIIDTPPTAGELLFNALMAANGLIIPLEADAYNLQSLYQMTDTARQIQEANADLQITGFILTKFVDARTKFGRQLRDMMTEQAAGHGIPCLGAVRYTIAVKEAAGLQKSLFSYAPHSTAEEDYMEIYEHIAQEV